VAMARRLADFYARVVANAAQAVGVTNPV
jgi:hypothetical protein